MAKKAVRAEPSASLAAPFASTATLGVLVILAVLGILGIILVAINPVFRLMAYIGISAAVVYYLGQVIKVPKKKWWYLLASFFGLLTIFLVAPQFMTIFPETNLQVATGEIALNEPVLISSLAVLFLPVVLSVIISAIIWGKARTAVQRALLSLSAVLVSMFVVFIVLVGA